MTSRERFRETLAQGRPDRPAEGDYFAYQSTRERWEREGLPPGVDLNDYFGMDFYPFDQRWRAPIQDYVIPPYEAKVLEETSEYTVRREGSGDIVKVLKNTRPPAMPQFLAHPLSCRADWDDFKLRLDPDTPERVPKELFCDVAVANGGEYPHGVWAGGTYGYLRNWWGVENVSLLFYDDPALIEEMIEALIRLYGGLFDRVVAAGVKLDWVMFWEDMGYKTASLLSPDFYRKYCLPFYRVMMDKVRAAGVPVVMIDSDGNVDELIPLWFDLGITVMHPMEVASGMDIRAARKKYGSRLGCFGGIDKRALAGTREDLRAEVLPKLEACLGEGGFIPACDHGIPPDVSFDNYRYFRELVRQAGERL